MFDYITFWLAHEFAKLLWVIGIIILAILGVFVYVFAELISCKWKMRRGGFRYRAMYNTVDIYLGSRGPRSLFDATISIIYHGHIDRQTHNPDKFEEALLRKVYLDITNPHT